MGCIVLSHESALSYWRSPFARHAGTRRCSQHGAQAILDEASSQGSDLEGVFGRSPVLQYLGTPLHVMVGSPRKARRSATVVAHCHTAPTVPGCFVMVARGIYVCSPEFVFVQLCRTAGLTGAILLGCELCGDYREDGEGQARPWDGAPLTDRASLADACLGLGASRGIRAARVAARFVMDGARTPLAARLAVYLTLPRSYGGEAFERPRLDHVVRVAPELRRDAGFSSLRCDAYWPDSRTVLELERRPDAHARRKAFEALEMGVVETDSGTLATWQGLDLLVGQLRAATGASRRPDYIPHFYDQKRALLRRELLGAQQPDVPRPACAR